MLVQGFQEVQVLQRITVKAPITMMQIISVYSSFPKHLGTKSLVRALLQGSLPRPQLNQASGLKAARVVKLIVHTVLWGVQPYVWTTCVVCATGVISDPCVFYYFLKVCTHSHTLWKMGVGGGFWGEGGLGGALKTFHVQCVMKPQRHTHTDRSVRTGGRGVSVIFFVEAWKLGMVVADCMFIWKFLHSGPEGIVRCLRC